MDPAAVALAESKLATALTIWERCVSTDTWPGYPSRIAWAAPRDWQQAQWLEQAEAILSENQQ